MTGWPWVVADPGFPQTRTCSHWGIRFLRSRIRYLLGDGPDNSSKQRYCYFADGGPELGGGLVEGEDANYLRVNHLHVEAPADDEARTKIHHGGEVREAAPRQGQVANAGYSLTNRRQAVVCNRR